MASLRALGLVLVAGCAGGAGATVAPPNAPSPVVASSAPDAPEPPPRGTDPRLVPALVEPAIGDDAVADELTAIATTNDAELLAFLDRAAAPATLPKEVRATLARPRPAEGVDRAAIELGRVVAFVRRSAKEDRAAVFARSSADGHARLVPPVAWVAEVVKLPGATEADANAWYRAMSRRVATAGRATGLAVFANGNAIAIALELRAVDDDVELAGVTRFLEAREVRTDAWGPVVRGAERVSIARVNDHDGVRAFDILLKVRKKSP